MRILLRFLGLSVSTILIASAVSADNASLALIDQGPNWNAAARTDFYSRDQGSRMIPLSWLQALKQSDGNPFLGDGLSRYGYLPNSESKNRLPLGFSISGPTGAETVGLTCSACHTRQITADGKAYRIDGGPAIVDFQGLLTDLDAAVGRVLASDTSFTKFASATLRTATPDSTDVLSLHNEVSAWYARFHALTTRALPSPAWGLGRLDAVGMIFDRLTGLDIGPPPSFLIADNIKNADAPVRYPFLWNAAVQDETQWPGFADNGSDVLALARNLGEVVGVFGVFEPTRDGHVVNFLNDNSANFDGLGKLEDIIKKIGPPKWPWAIDAQLASEGEKIFNRPTVDGGCQACHGVAPGQVRFFQQQTWLTPIQDVGTDTKEYDTISRSAETGVLQGAFVPFVTSPLKARDSAINVLATSVVGSIAEHVLSDSGTSSTESVPVATKSDSNVKLELHPASEGLPRLPPELKDLQGAFHTGPSPETVEFHVGNTAVPTPSKMSAILHVRGAYEARVLQGIWAAAPYLHNGSVPSLAELLKPAAERIPKFQIGPEYDKDAVGLAVYQSPSSPYFITTGCDALNSGDSNCGHEYGTKLTLPEKKALLEYLKTL